MGRFLPQLVQFQLLCHGSFLVRETNSSGATLTEACFALHRVARTKLTNAMATLAANVGDLMR